MTVSNPVSGELQELSKGALLELFESEVIKMTLGKWMSGPLVEGIVVFECLDLSPPNVGHRSAVYWGPQAANRSLSALAAGHLGELPSKFLYPKYFWRRGS